MEAWRNLQNKPTYAIVFFIGLALFLSSLQLTIRYVSTFETREGFVPYDPFMTYLPAVDMSAYIFLLLYGTVIFAAFYFIQDPKILLTFAFTFGFMYYIRALCITLVPFNEPASLIPLSDPFIEKLGVYQAFVKRDLFFSGHFASVFIPYLILRKIRFNWVFLASAVAMGIMIMFQHIHYSYDIFGAIVFSYLSYYLADKLIAKFQF
ncbi:MAG: phosphatase PAP2-related protein [Saprospiraceae bacterium]|nr:phosphatase PAP2-related protein [Saprospiraceae bacterium]